MASELLRERRVAPSILSADFARLGSQVDEVISAGARVIHVDVMDGHFVPPITLGPLIVGAIADTVHSAGALIDVHLMIERPERQVSEFARRERTTSLSTLRRPPRALRPHRNPRGGCSACAAICPATPAEVLSEVAGDTLDMALCMSVNPGWGAQALIPDSLASSSACDAHYPITWDGSRRRRSRADRGGMRERRSELAGHRFGGVRIG